MPVRNASCPVFDVSMWPLNIRFWPPPLPLHRPTTLARPSSTSCQVTSSPSCFSALFMYSAICSSSPVGLGMLITSHAIATISSSRSEEHTTELQSRGHLVCRLLLEKKKKKNKKTNTHNTINLII